MRRVKIWLAILAALMIMVPVASVSAATCTPGPALGVARLQVNNSGIPNFGEGSSRWYIDGTMRSAPFVETDAVFTGPGLNGETTHEYHFGSKTLVVREFATPHLLGAGPWVRIDSTVVVLSGGAGSLRYDGLYNLDTRVARFVISGSACLD